MQKFSLEAAAASDVGLERSYNEDRAGSFPDLGLFFVADGMGGSSSGDKAAEAVHDAVLELFQKTAGQAHPSLPFELDAAKTEEENRLACAVRLSNERILALTKTNRMYTGIGSTFAGISIQGATATIGHVGDSRVYRMRDGKLDALTRDHSLINDYKQYLPNATPEELANVPKNVITRAVGMGDKIEVDTRHIDVRRGDVFLVTTDGVHGLVSDAALGAALLESPNAAECARRVITVALAAGGTDNASCVVVVVR